MACLRNHSSGDADLGSPIWFCVEKKLNHYGYVPGVPRRETDALPDGIASEEQCTLRWGKKIGGKFWYAKKACSESPRMRYRVEKLYQVTHQRPIGNQRGISLGFARGLLAEKLGYAVDWASYAAKQCRRGGKSFQTIEDLKSKTKAVNGDWPSNEVFEEDESIFEGAPDDWEVNRMVKDLNPQFYIGYNLRETLPTIPEDIVTPPMYTGGPNFKVTMESESLEASSESESKDGEDNGGDGKKPEEVEDVSRWHGESSKGKHTTAVPCRKWDGCPLSPDVSAGFPDGARTIHDEVDDEDGNNYTRYRDIIGKTVKETSVGHGKQEHTYVGNSSRRATSDDPPLGLDLFLEVYGTISVEMDSQATRDGYNSFTVDQKFEYLRNQEVQYEAEWRKRRAEENARLQWIAAKRRRTEYPASLQTATGLHSTTMEGEHSISDDIDMYERPEAVICGNAQFGTGEASASSLGELLRVSGGSLDLSHLHSGNVGEVGIPSSPISMSPLRFANLPLMIPGDVGNHSADSKVRGSRKNEKTTTIIIPDSDTE